jgi:transcriptional regulator with AAA-type ATPase domain/dihydroxyacetone kinase DhaKLM complex PTS-EIIA-like component DhaM
MTMKKKKYALLAYMQEKKQTERQNEFTASQLAEELDLQRTNVSAMLNELADENLLLKVSGKPVYFRIIESSYSEESAAFRPVAGRKILASVYASLQSALRSSARPVKIMMTETGGNGASTAARAFYQYASQRGKANSYQHLNCLYFVNDKEYLREEASQMIEKAEHGILFIDHIECITDSRIIYDIITACDRKNIILIFCVCTKDDDAYKKQYGAQIPLWIRIPDFSEWTNTDRWELVQSCLKLEAQSSGTIIQADPLLLWLLIGMHYDNVRQAAAFLQNDVASASFRSGKKGAVLKLSDFPKKIISLETFSKSEELNEIVPLDFRYVFLSDGSIRTERRKDCSLKDIKKRFLQAGMNEEEAVKAAGLIHYPEEVLKKLPEDNGDRKGVDQTPCMLVIMHGENTASSIADVIRRMSLNEHVVAYDLNLDGDRAGQKKELSELIAAQNCTHGLVVYYDMGSIRKMVQDIAAEQKITVVFCGMPVTLIGISLAEKLAVRTDLNCFQEQTEEIYGEAVPWIVQDYKRFNAGRVIVVSDKGDGTMQSLKRYLNDNLKSPDMEVKVIEGNREGIRKRIKELQKERNIISVTGDIDPEMKSVKYVSPSSVLACSASKLDYLMNGGKEPERKRLSLHQYFDELEDRDPSFDAEGLRKYMPGVLKELSGRYAMDHTDMVRFVFRVSDLIKDRKLPMETRRFPKKETAYMKKVLDPLLHYYGLSVNDNAIRYLIGVCRK